jgi:hypothetical protein
MDPKELVNSSWGEFLKISSKDITVLLVADTSAGNFLMNPQGFGAGWRLGNRYNHETEVIAGGQVPLVSAAWIWFGETAGRQRRGASSSNKPHARVLDKLLAAVEETGRMLGDDRP